MISSHRASSLGASITRTALLSTVLYAAVTIAIFVPALACEDSNWSGVWCQVVDGCAYILDFPLGTFWLSPPGEPRFPLHAIPNGIVVGITFAFGRWACHTARKKRYVGGFRVACAMAGIRVASSGLVLAIVEWCRRAAPHLGEVNSGGMPTPAAEDSFVVIFVAAPALLVVVTIGWLVFERTFRRQADDAQSGGPAEF